MARWQMCNILAILAVHSSIHSWLLEGLAHTNYTNNLSSSISYAIYTIVIITSSTIVVAVCTVTVRHYLCYCHALAFILACLDSILMQ